MRLLFPALAFAFITLSPMARAADAPLCTSDAVTLGDSQADVRRQCGEPLAQRSYCGVLAAVDRLGATPEPPVTTPCVDIEQWNYRSGSGKPTTVLKFVSGRLRSIDDDRSATSPSER